MRNIHVISASAGSGGTQRLSEYLRNAVSSGQVRPEAVIAATFTDRTAAELSERARRHLLERGRPEAAHRLLAARIGTVNAVCGGLVSEFCRELGLSPSLAVIDEQAAERALRRTLAQVLCRDPARELRALSLRLDCREWPVEIRHLVAAARANAIEPAALPDCARRSADGLLALVGAAAADAADAPNAFHSDLRRFIELAFAVAADVLAEYQAHKQRHDLVDFTDQKALALAALRRPDVRDRLRGGIDLVLVDEFQDAGPLELAVFFELAALAPAVWVGDDKQALSGFRSVDPALADAAIEDLASPTSDPDLVGAALAAAAPAPPEILIRSCRGRAELVDLTNRIFGAAFCRRGIPTKRVHLEAPPAAEPAGVGGCCEYWPLARADRGHAGDAAVALAAGVADFLASPGEQVRDRVTGAPRPLVPGDVAVLCRTNAQCRQVARALEALGQPAAVARAGLFATAEGQVARAALRLWVDAGDPLAAAELARIVAFPDRPDEWLARVLTRPGTAAFAGEACVRALFDARAAARFAGPVEALDAAIEAIRLVALCRAWGDAEARLANVDAIRAHAVIYTDRCAGERTPATLAGLLAYWDELADPPRGEPAEDLQAICGGDDAVTVTTWHAAGGREWPVVVLFGLEQVRDPLPTGVRVAADRPQVSATDPLAGRWIRFWPSVDRGASTQQSRELRDRVRESDAAAEARERAAAELLRLAYVGWTRAGDRLVLAAREGELTAGILGAVTDADGALLREPGRDGGGRWPEIARVRWAGRAVDVRIRPAAPAPPRPREATPGRAYPERDRRAHPPAFVAPSDLGGGEAATTGEPIRIGDRLPVAGVLDMARLGSAVHGFLAVEGAEIDRHDRLVLAASHLSRWRVGGALRPEHLVEAGDALRAWIEHSFPGATWYREWPLFRRLPHGTVVRCAPNLVLRHGDQVIVIDHKTFAGTDAQAIARAGRHAPELAAYAAALATAGPPPRAYVHLPILGQIIPLR